MKKILYFILFIFTTGFLFNSCEEDILDRTPLDAISDPDFWKNDNDLELYLNSFYSSLQAWWDTGSAPSPDLGTDIVIESQEWWGFSYTEQLDGTLSVPASGGGWNWGNIRSVNFFLENAERAQQGDLIDHYIGEGHFFRAWYYFELLTRFGGVPIITQVLNVNDEELLFPPRNSRTEVVDFILSDLDAAISKMKVASDVGPSRVNKDVASLFKARVCLYEGTWEKYHQGTDFAGDTDGSQYLQMAATAAKTVMDGGRYSLYTGDPQQAYYELFVQTDYSSNPEVLLYKHYDAHNAGVGNSLWNHPNVQGMTHGMTKNYLSVDGLPIAESPLFEGDATLDVIEINRDPRLENSIMVPGELDFISATGDSSLFQVPFMTRTPTGYELEKWRTHWLDPLRNNMRTWDVGYIYFRYAEALLIYAEAKAELGTLTQSDVDISINLLRDRVGMPHLNLASITPDPNWPDYGYALPDYLYEVRRERVVELFGEGFRFDDLMRWRAHNLWVGKRPTGTMLTDLIREEYPNVNSNEEGYIDPFETYLDGGAYGFNPNRDYLLPLPTNELTLNPNLDQNPGWE